ncbi:MAG: Holliday junction DNA helicase RuvA [Candidatus Magasanikbacteria bacterium RIFOXYC2_FULL_40_16]|uniref:Holliday junction branch migration complex subunit RuvA n=1 Tax=Candidatus Magasanikbacteria bacterium RIFOXYC2_FULL_40_16 TaxID=1798703 RepID=A0A1F6NZW9_9BACT|nr:MAG: Holliday junction DNA helicase RuvA [Candidatus Magasanikbacteria bacterium RIFOXYC2_FULL_40_16]
MISFIKGTIHSVDKDNVVVQTTGGVGYKIFLSKNIVLKYLSGQEASFFTYLKVSDSALDLYGFENTEQKEFFELLLSVSGVGPKSAMNILNLGSIDDIKGAIARQDVKYLTTVQGMGQKTAERLVVELKNKIGKMENMAEITGDSQILADVIDGLASMGYGKEEAKDTVKSIDTKNKTTEQVLREALKRLSK